MNIQALSQTFWLEGYIHIPGFFSSDEMDVLNTLCLNHFGLDPSWEHTSEFIDKSNCEIVPWFPLRDDHVPEFAAVQNNKNFKELTGAILGDDFHELYCMSMFSKRGTAGQAWHQDSPPDDPAKFNLNRLIYTHDISDETGGQVVIVPGTHKLGMITTGDPNENIENEVVLNPKKGDVVILHGHCWHKVRPVTGTYRVSTNFRAVPEGTPETITDTAIYRNMKYYFPTNEVLEERI